MPYKKDEDENEKSLLNKPLFEIAGDVLAAKDQALDRIKQKTTGIEQAAASSPPPGTPRNYLKQLFNPPERTQDFKTPRDIVMNSAPQTQTTQQPTTIPQQVKSAIGNATVPAHQSVSQTVGTQSQGKQNPYPENSWRWHRFNEWGHTGEQQTAPSVMAQQALTDPNTLRKSIAKSGVARTLSNMATNVEQIKNGQVLTNQFDESGGRKMFDMFGKEMSRADLEQMENMGTIQRLALQASQPSRAEYKEVIDGYDKDGHAIYKYIPPAGTSSSQAALNTLQALGGLRAAATIPDTLEGMAKARFTDVSTDLAPSRNAAMNAEDYANANRLQTLTGQIGKDSLVKRMMDESQIRRMDAETEQIKRGVTGKIPDKAVAAAISAAMETDPMGNTIGFNRERFNEVMGQVRSAYGASKGVSDAAEQVMQKQVRPKSASEARKQLEAYMKTIGRSYTKEDIDETLRKQGYLK